MIHIGTDLRGEPFSISLDTHAGVIGKSGTGKTTLLENIIIKTIEDGGGVTVIDPHGDLVDRALDFVPPFRINDVRYFDPTCDRNPGIPALETGSDPATSAENIVRIFRSLWPDSWGPRSEWLLQGYITALASYPKPVSLVSLYKALTSKAFRQKLADTPDAALQAFFATVDSWTPKFREEALSPLINKIGRLVLNPHLRVSLGQPKPSLSYASILSGRGILLCKINIGKLRDGASLLGSILVSGLTQAALARDTVDRAPHLLVVDELQNFIHGVDFATILAQGRKYGLRLLPAAQTLSQLSDETRSAVYGNCGTLIAFRTSGVDGDELRREMATDRQRWALQSTPNFQCLVRTMHPAGYPTETHLVGASVPRPPTGRADRVRTESLRRWGRPRAKIERRIDRHLRR
jgi:hypothetical protein